MGELPLVTISELPMSYDSRDRFARVNFGGAPLSNAMRDRWDGKIVSREGGEYWSLGGIQDEGIGLSGCEAFMRELTDEELVVAKLLEATFFRRDFYSEDFAVLYPLLKLPEPWESWK